MDFRGRVLLAPLTKGGNLPFRHAARIIRWARRRGSVVTSLLPAGFGDQEDAERLLREDPAAIGLRPTGGRLGFLGDGKDFQHHEALTWRGPARPLGGCSMYTLPPLPAHLRSWTERPGTEELFTPLPRHLYPTFGAAHG